MQLFYTPDINPPHHTLTEDESKHCIRVLRLAAGDEVNLTDGRGNLYRALVTDPNPKACRVEVAETRTQWGRRSYRLTMAVAPTKNIDRFEWFLEKATEVGCDVFIPLECEHSERRVIKPERELKVITSAVKQSLKAYHPELEPMARFRDVVARGFDGIKLIAHCNEPLNEPKYIADCITRGDDVLVLIGPEGDFSPEEVALAVGNGFTEITLGQSRLRTETAAVDAVIEVALANR